MLDALSSAGGGGAVIEALLASADQIFGIDVGSAVGFKRTITDWLKGEPRIIVP